MRAYNQYCPVARALEVVGDRWSLLIVRELLAGPSHFNEIERGLPGISRTLLSQRLQMLESGGVVERGIAGPGRPRLYGLTAAGEELRALVGTIAQWGARWAFDDPRPSELDPAWLLTSMLRRRRVGGLARRVVIEFRLRGSRRSYLWLLLDPHEQGEVCLKHPGFQPDLVVTAETRALFRFWLGRLSRAEAERSGLLTIEGVPEMRKAFAGWFEWPALPPAARTGSPRPAAAPRSSPPSRGLA
jgi:DNA-binding HxlR family transcriptional regulator